MENKLIFEEATECPICLETFHLPASTPCGHNFCIECMQKLLKHRFYRMKCPICRSLIPKSGYKLNKLLDELLSVINPTGSSKNKINDINFLAQNRRKNMFHVRKIIMLLAIVMGFIVARKNISIAFINKLWFILSKFSSIVATVLFGQYAVFGQMFISNFISIVFRSSIVW
ncbi:unnamed protein product [Blepharisma stoltei]|uniref:RING-type domain-containing protein n=1 Tax=Blepharisma stoltei TaxID=1481888 RepID=A0AAU9K988_9CILI|nr:unnamed protein product [Blepharisma stoltei]